MLLAENHDIVWQGLIAAVAMLVLGWMNQRSKAAADKAAAAANDAATEAAHRAEEVKNALASNTASVTAHAVDVKNNLIESNTVVTAKLENLETTTKATLAHVNHDKEMMLKLNAELSRWKADTTAKARDLEAAEMAERLYQEHKQQQDLMDKGAGRDG